MICILSHYIELINFEIFIIHLKLAIQNTVNTLKYKIF